MYDPQVPIVPDTLRRREGHRGLHPTQTTQFRTASTHALLKLNVTSLNEKLIRTYHHSLDQRDGVWVFKELDGSDIWVVAPGPHLLALDAHARGDTHSQPIFKFPTHPVVSYTLPTAIISRNGCGVSARHRLIRC